jgi:hypothetical protein
LSLTLGSLIWIISLKSRLSNIHYLLGAKIIVQPNSGSNQEDFFYVWSKEMILIEEVIVIVRLGLNSGSDVCGLALIIYIYLLFLSFNSFSHPFFY